MMTLENCVKITFFQRLTKYVRHGVQWYMLTSWGKKITSDIKHLLSERLCGSKLRYRQFGSGSCYIIMLTRFPILILTRSKKCKPKIFYVFLLFNQQQFSVQTKGRILLQFLNPDPARLIRIGITEQNCAGLSIQYNLRLVDSPPPCLGERIEFSIISTHHIRLQEVACATMNKR